jgi:hypothetical protein
MKKFSATNAAFTGFRIVRERPTAVAVWAAVQLAISLITTMIMIVTAGPALTEFSRASMQGSQDPAATMAALQKIAPLLLGMLVYMLAFYSVAWAAMNRAVLRPEDSRFGYLRFGADELRQLGVLLLFCLIMFGAEVVAVFASVLAGVALAFVAKPLAILVPILFVPSALSFVACRLSLGSPMTFDSGRIRFFESWALTKGRFWPIFGCYALAAGLALVVGLLGLVIQVSIGALLGGGLQAGGVALFRPDLSSLATGLSPPRLATFVVGAGLMAILLPVIMTPAAAIYRAVTRSEGEAIADVF